MDIRLRYRIKDIGAGVPGQWVEYPFNDWVATAGLVPVDTPPVPANKLLQVQAALTGPAGTYSPWSTPITEVTSTSDPVAPGVITNLVATPGVGQVVFTWKSPNSANYASTVILRNITNTETGATELPAVYGAPNTAHGYTDSGLAAGTYFYFLKARNGSLVASASLASGAKTVT
jgi:hypothetical protein